MYCYLKNILFTYLILIVDLITVYLKEKINYRNIKRKHRHHGVIHGIIGITTCLDLKHRCISHLWDLLDLDEVGRLYIWEHRRIEGPSVN